MSIILRSIVVVIFGALLATAIAQEDLGDFFQVEPGDAVEAAANTGPPSGDALPLEVADVADDLEEDVNEFFELDDATKPTEPVIPTEPLESEDNLTTDFVEDLQADLVGDTDESNQGASNDSVIDGADDLDGDDLNNDRPEPEPTTDGDLDELSDSDLDLGVKPAEGKAKSKLFGESIRARSVILDDQDGFDGAIGTLVGDRSNIVPTSQLSVEIFDDESRRIREVVADSNGRFRVEGLSTGVYQFVARGEAGFLAFSLIVLDQDAAAKRGLGRADRDELFFVQVPLGTRESIEVVAAAVPPTFEEVNSIVKLHYGVSMPMYMLRNNPQPAEAAEPVPANPLDRRSPFSKNAVRTYEVPLGKGNRIKGRLVKYEPGSLTPISASKVYVHIIRNDKAVGLPIRVNRRGEFEAELPDGPGAYSLVAAGKGGFGAAGFFAYVPDEPKVRTRDELEANHRGVQPPGSERTFLVSTELAQGDTVDLKFNDPLIDEMEAQRNRIDIPVPGGIGGGAGGGAPVFAICSNEVIAPQQQVADGGQAAAPGGGAGGGGAGAGFGGGSGVGFAPPAAPSFAPPGFPAFPSSPLSAPTGGGFVGGGGGIGGRGLAPLLIGGGVAAAIAISVDDDDRRQVSPFAP